MFIAWNRLTRPGSILGPQQQFLVSSEQKMFSFPSQLHNGNIIRCELKRERDPNTGRERETRHYYMHSELQTLPQFEHTGSQSQQQNSRYSVGSNTSYDSQYNDDWNANNTGSLSQQSNNTGGLYNRIKNSGLFGSGQKNNGNGNNGSNTGSGFQDESHLFTLGKIDYEIFHEAKRAPEQSANQMRPGSSQSQQQKTNYGGIFSRGPAQSSQGSTVATPGAFTANGQAGQGDWLIQQKRNGQVGTRGM